MKIDAWGNSKIEDYNHVFKEFGLEEFNYENIVDHYLFKRKILIAQRDFNKISDAIKNKKPFLQLTGIASSGDLHLGHKLDIDFFNLFKNLGAKGKFCICDIDAYVSRPDSKVPSLDFAKKVAIKNVADIIALGVNPNDIYVQSQKEKEYYSFVFELSKKISSNMFEGIYGHKDIGKISAVLLQIGDILHIQLPFMWGKNPTITGIGLEQDPHARITRDISRELNYNLEVPSFFYFEHQSGLKEGSKMSSSEPSTAIFLKDSPAEVKRKILNAFTGGKETLEEQKENGGNPEICKIYEIIRFHNPDSSFLEKTYTRCKEGKLNCGDCKKNCTAFLNNFLENHQKRCKEAMNIAEKIVLGKQ